METRPTPEKKIIYVRERPTDDVFMFWRTATAGEIQPERASPEKLWHTRGRTATGKIFKTGTTFALLLVTSAFAVSISTTHQTLSYFSDLDGAKGNTLGAGLLDFVVNAGSFEGTVTADEDGHIVINPSASEEPGSFQLEYKVKAEKTGGTSDVFCSALHANALGSLAYDGPLIDLAAGPTQSVGPYEVTISLPDPTGVSNGDTCLVDLVYSGWNSQVPDEEGYTDEERVHLTFTANIPVEGFAALAEPLLDLFSNPEPEGNLSSGEGSISDNTVDIGDQPDRGGPTIPDVPGTLDVPGVPDIQQDVPPIPNVPTDIPDVPDVPPVPDVTIPDSPEPPSASDFSPA